MSPHNVDMCFFPPFSLLPGKGTIKQNELANRMVHGAFLVGKIVKNHPAMQETCVFCSSILSTSWRGNFSLQTLFLWPHHHWSFPGVFYLSLPINAYKEAQTKSYSLQPFTNVHSKGHCSFPGSTKTLPCTHSLFLNQTILFSLHSDATLTTWVPESHRSEPLMQPKEMLSHQMSHLLGPGPPP